MLEIEDFRPRVPEIGNPRDARGALQAPPDQVHRMRRAGRHDKVHRVLRQVFFQETDGRADPGDPGIRDESVPADPHDQPLLEGFALAVDDIDLRRRGLPAGQRTVDAIDFGDGTADDFHLGRDVRIQALVLALTLRILRRIDHRLPAFGRKILGEFDPPLHPGTAAGRPVIGNDENPSHKHTNVKTNS